MRPCKIASLCIVTAACTLAALPASAVDGVRELNQVCAATGCVPDDDPGFPIELSADGHYRLTGPLAVGNGDTTAIAVASDYVTIDLNGFTITGITYYTGTPVTSCAPTGTGVGINSTVGRLEVRNGVVRCFGASGIRAGHATIIDGVRLEENDGDGLLATPDAQGWVVRNCLIRRNGGDGIAMSGTISGALITGNSIAGNSLAGLLATRGIASNNVVSSNGGFGLQTGTGVGLVGNTFSSNNGG